MDRIVNYIRLTWKLACMLRTYRICNSIVGFSKYEFNNKLLDCVKLFRVTLGITWTQPILPPLQHTHTHTHTHILLLFKGFLLFEMDILLVQK